MGISVVSGAPHVIWSPITDSDTLYVGQIVKVSAEGVAPLATASGAYDTTTKAIPFGVVVGTNLRTPSFDATYKADKITDASPHGTTTEYVLHDGPWSKGDAQAMVKVALITPETVLRAPLYNAAVGTAPTVGTVTTGSAAGTQATGTSALCDVAGVANLGTVYFRSGANQGAYRVTDDTDDGTTAITWDKPTVYDVAAGDTLVRVNLRPQGLSRLQFDSESTYVNVAAALTADYFGVNVIRLDLSTAGKEFVDFSFLGDHFSPNRA